MASTRQNIIDELKQLLEADEITAIKDQVEHLKTRFYSCEEVSEIAEEASREEEEFKALLSDYKARRAEVTAAQNSGRDESVGGGRNG